VYFPGESKTVLPRFNAPQGFALHQYHFSGPDSMYYIPETFLCPLHRNKVKIALGAILVGADTPKDLANPGLAVFCIPNRFWERDENASGHTELKKWANELEFLSAVVALLKEEIVLPALGGTAYRNPGIRVMRVLKGFGGCRFIQQLVYGKIKLLEMLICKVFGFKPNNRYDL